MVKHRILVVLAGGGFYFETNCLLQRLASEFTFIYMLTEYGGKPGIDGIPPGTCYRVKAFANFSHPSRLRSLPAVVSTFVRTLSIVRREKINFILAVGCSHAVPMLLAGRALRVRTIFVESITRADVLSMTGKLVDALRLADLFIVQWPVLQKKHPRTRLGTIL